MSTNKKATKAEEVEVIIEDTTKVNETPKAEPKVNIAEIIAKLPDNFTPATLDKLFQLDDGGKTIRRHLRKHFTESYAHEHKANWTFNKAQADEIIAYFANLYTPNLTVLTAAK